MKHLAFVVCFLAAGRIGTAASLPPNCVDTSQPFRFVYDYADVLTEPEEARLNALLKQGGDSTNSTVVVVTHPDFCGLEPFEFATGLGEDWGVGKTGQDRGVVIAIKPRKGDAEGRVFIATGRGNEGELTDARTGRIVRAMTPFFASGRFALGIEEGILEIYSVLTAVETRSEIKRPTMPWPAVALLMFVFFVVPLWVILHGVRKMSRTFRVPWWSAWAVFWAAQRHSNTRFSDFSRGSGPFGGGGFGGFGGGRFGGGGAGGSF